MKQPWIVAWVAGLTFCALILPLGARAQTSDDERARLHFESGRSHFQDGAYDRALEEFERAYELSHRSVLLINMANCSERLGEPRVAVANLRAYLEAEPEASDRATIERRIANLERLAAQQEAREAELGAATTTSVEPTESESVPEPAAVESAASPEVAPEPAAESEGRSLVGPIVGFSAAGVGAVMMVTFGAMALHEQNSLEEGCGVTGSCTDAQVRKADNYALVADIGMGLAIAGAAVGVVLLLVGGDDEEEAAQARVSPWVARGSAGAAAEVRF